MFSFIPFDLQINILERLPVKNIIRFSAVNKSWYSTIKTQGLVKTHHKFSKSLIANSEDESHILLMSDELTNGCENRCFLLSEGPLETFKYNFSGNNNSIYVSSAGSCNGVICLARSHGVYGKELFLFNPSIRIVRSIPSSLLEDQLEKSSHRVSRHVGFGYDETSDDYKVIRLYSIYERRVLDSVMVELEKMIMAEVYSLRCKYWKRVEAIQYGLSTRRPVSINNASYCLFLNEDESHTSIIAFDFRAEVFREIQSPHDIVLEVTYLLSYKGSLALLVVDEASEDELDEEEEEEEDEEEEEEEEEEDESEEEAAEDYLEEGVEEEDEMEEDVEEEDESVEEGKATVTLWIMKSYGEETWKEEFTRVIPGSYSEPVEFTKTGKLIFWKTKTDLALWDPESGKVVDVDELSNKLPIDDCIIVKDYVESLILL
ncbi:putative F-box domain-containing protein [Helianthus anomalus]